MAQWIKDLPHKHEDQSLDPQHPYKKAYEYDSPSVSGGGAVISTSCLIKLEVQWEPGLNESSEKY